MERADELESILERINAAGYLKEFKHILQVQMSFKKALASLNKNHPDFLI